MLMKPTADNYQVGCFTLCKAILSQTGLKVKIKHLCAKSAGIELSTEVNNWLLSSPPDMCMR